MKKTFFYFRFSKTLFAIYTSIFTLNTVQSTPSQHVCENIQREHKAAVDISKKFQRGLITKEQAIDVLLDVFTDYSHPDGKTATLAQFIRKTTDLDNPIIRVAVEQRGWSGNEVYAVKNKGSSEPQFFLKLFTWDAKFYLPEIFGLSFMSEVKEVASPKIYSLGQCVIDGKQFFLVLQTSLKGLSIQQYFSRVGEQPYNSKERSKCLIELYDAVRICGYGLAKFHLTLPVKKQSFPYETEKHMRQDLNSAIEALKNYPDHGINITNLQIYIDYMHEQMKKYDHLVGLAYEDIKTVHTFYDAENYQFGLVNPHKVFLSFDANEETQGLLVKDVCKYLLSLTLNRHEYYLDPNQNVSRRELLSIDETNEVKAMFEYGYHLGGGILPDELERDYILLHHNLFFIKNSMLDLPEPESTRVKYLIDISIDSLKSKLNKLF